MALTDLQFVQDLSGDTTSTSEIIFTRLLDVSQSIIENFCGRKFSYDTYTEYQTSNNFDFIFLKQRPVWTITSIHLDRDGRFDQVLNSQYQSSTLLLAHDDYALVYDGQIDNTRVSISGMVNKVKGTWFEYFRYRRDRTLYTEITPPYGDIKVVYTGGYKVIPYDIQFASAQLVMFMKRSFKLGGQVLTKEVLGQAEYRVSDEVKNSPMLSDTRQILNNYREVPW